MKLGLLLIALGVGYKVYADASKEKGRLRTLGQWVGALIMAVSFGVSALVLYAYSVGSFSGRCPFEKGPYPFSAKPAALSVSQK